MRTLGNIFLIYFAVHSAPSSASEKVSEIQVLQQMAFESLMCQSFAKFARNDSELKWVVYENDVERSNYSADLAQTIAENSLSANDVNQLYSVVGAKYLNASDKMKNELKAMGSVEKKKSGEAFIEKCRSVWDLLS